MRKQYLKFLTAPLCVLLALAQPAQAQPGALDPFFANAYSNSDPIRTAVALPDGKVLVGSATFNNPVGSIQGVQRLNVDGSVDNTWNGAITWSGVTSPYPQGVRRMALRPGGAHFAIGTNNSSYFLITSLANGTVDGTVPFNAFQSGTALALGAQSTGRAVVAGAQTPATTLERGIVAYGTDGLIDPSFGAPAGGITLENSLQGHTVSAGTASVQVLVVQPDDKIIIAGNFTHYDGVETGNIARLNADGSLDGTFSAGLGTLDTLTGTFGPVSALALDGSDRVYVGGSFTTINDGGTASGIVRLNADGTPDATFHVTGISNGAVTAITSMQNWTIIGGTFSVAGTTPVRGIAMLNNDGSVNADFLSGAGTGFGADLVSVDEIAISPAGIYVAGEFESYNGMARHNVLRLQSIQLTVPPNRVLCDGTNVQAINLPPLPPTFTASWTNDNAAIGLAASGVGNVPAFTATNSGNTPITGRISIDIKDTAGSFVKHVVYLITVKPAPTVNAVSGQTLCAGDNTAPVAFTGPVSGTSFGWTNDNTNIGLRASGTGNIAAFRASNNSGSVETANITVTPTADHCAGTPVSFALAVSPSAGTISYPAAEYCQTGNAVPQRTGSQGGSFSATPGGLVMNAANGQVNLALSAPGTYTITYTVAATGGCSATANTQLTVKPQATVNAVPNQYFCNGIPTTPINFTGTAASYTWTSAATGFGLPASGTGNIGSFTPTALASTTIRVTPIGNGSTTCTGKPFTFAVRVSSCTVASPGNTGGDDNTLRATLVSLSPNPAREQVNVTYNGTNSGPLTLTLVNSNGVIALRPASFTGNRATLNLSSLLPGTYMLQITDTRTGTMVQKQVIKL
ncbi:MAG: T9SS type A sorting domain-containing protein [Chitinophagaceae bacterium]|nr:MAG: T9SS type A sorting domain-containing protein [Chitinophagaceae bacterium]